MADPTNRFDGRSGRAALAKAMAGGSDAVLRMVSELDAAIESLRVRYDQYFQGQARVPPTEEHNHLRATLLRLKSAAPRNAAGRFRLQAVHNRFLSYERMWVRTVREIEEGTYRKHLLRARRRSDAGAQPQEAAPARKPDRGGDAPVSDGQLRQVFDAYVAARRRCNEDTSGLTFEALSKRLRAQLPGVLEKHGARSVDFKVVIRGGKAYVKAIPK